MDPEGWLNEYFHITQMQANSQLTGLKSAWLGTICEVFPDGTVTVANILAGPIPQANQQVSPSGLPVGVAQIIGPMPLCSMYAGCTNGINPINNAIIPGIQIMPLGGSSPNVPLAGELVLVLNLNNEIGYATCALFLFNAVAIPPGVSIPVTQAVLQPGEWLAVNPSGSTIHWKNNGDINIYTLQPPGSSFGSLNVMSNGAISLTTNVAGTVITDPTTTGDIWFTAIKDIESSARNFGVQTSVDIQMNAMNNVNISADVNAFFGSLNQTAITGGAVAVTATSGQLALEAFQNVTITSESADITTTSLNFNVNATDANFQLTDGLIVNSTNFNDIVSITGDTTLESTDAQINLLAGSNINAVAAANIAIQASQNIAISAIGGAFGDITLASTYYQVNLLAGTNINLTANNVVNITSIQDTFITSTTNNVVLQSDLVSIVLLAALDIDLTANNNINLTATEALNLASNTADITLTSAAQVSLIATTNINITGQNNVIVQATNGSMQLTTTGAAGNLTLGTVATATTAINTGTLDVTAATLVAMVAQGTKATPQGLVTIQDGSMNALVQLLTANFMLNLFNSHTHGGGPPPDQTGAAGYPLTTNCLEAN